jgi:N-acetylglucosaminyl-diphospho-decaprenol L-rhamnosyltransferase
VVVHFGDPAVTGRLLESIVEHAPLTEVVVVDNGGSGFHAFDPGQHHEVRVERPGENVGYGVACNLGAVGCTREFLLFLNNDVRLLPDAVRRLESALDADPGAAAVGPRVLDAGGGLVPSITRSPSPRRVLFENLFFPRLFPGVPFFHGHNTVLTSYGRPRAVESLLGAAFLFRRAAFESLGGFDPRYFFYCEESDLFRRARDGGWRILFEPSASLVHEGGTASSSVDRAELDRLAHRAFLTYAERFHGPEGAARTRRALRLGASLRWALAHLQPGAAGRQRQSRYRKILEMHRAEKPLLDS